VLPLLSLSVGGKANGLLKPKRLGSLLFEFNARHPAAITPPPHHPALPPTTAARNDHSEQQRRSLRSSPAAASGWPLSLAVFSLSRGSGGSRVPRDPGPIGFAIRKWGGGGGGGYRLSAYASS
jgi:hypothetical protein